jgi:hypothetical protein
VFITAVPITKLFARGGFNKQSFLHVSERDNHFSLPVVCFYYWSTYYKAVRVGGGGGNNGGYVLRGTTSRGLCALVCPSRTSERGGEGYCVKGGGGEEGERERERVREVRLHYSLG